MCVCAFAIALQVGNVHHAVHPDWLQVNIDSLSRCLSKVCVLARYLVRCDMEYVHTCVCATIIAQYHTYGLPVPSLNMNMK